MLRLNVFQIVVMAGAVVFSTVSVSDGESYGSPLQEITVGPANADVVGSTGRAIQIAIDALAHRGGGVVRILPGEYLCLDAVRLRSNITLQGDRKKTVLRRGPLVVSRLAVDAATSQRQITPKDATKFKPGMGVCTFDEASQWAHTAHPLTITNINDGVLQLSDYMTVDRLVEKGGLVVSHFPMIVGHEADDVVIEGLTIDGRVDSPEKLPGRLRTACVYLWRCKRATIRDIAVTGAVGDGICVAKSSIEATIEDCEVAHNGCFGIHPGSYSARCKVRRCEIHDNAYDGLYICWGIQSGEFTDNHIYRNGWGGYRGGISIGHQDTDNLIARNHIHNNAKYGIGFRDQTEANGAHRTTIRKNRIENNGSKPKELAEIKAKLKPWESIGTGILLRGITRDTIIEENIIRETRKGTGRTQRHGIVLHQGVIGTQLKGNQIEGHTGESVKNKSGTGS